MTASFPAFAALTSKVFLNQTTPSKSPGACCSHKPGTFITAQLLSSSVAVLHDGTSEAIFSNDPCKPSTLFLVAAVRCFAMESKLSFGRPDIIVLNSSLLSNASLLVQVSLCVPPHDVLSKPMGTFNSLTSSLAKKYPTAVKSAAVSGLHIFHSPPVISSLGSIAIVLGTLK